MFDELRLTEDMASACVQIDSQRLDDPIVMVVLVMLCLFDSRIAW